MYLIKINNYLQHPIVIVTNPYSLCVTIIRKVPLRALNSSPINKSIFNDFMSEKSQKKITVVLNIRT